MAVNPTFIQHVSTSNTGSTALGGSALVLQLPDPGGANNTLILGFQLAGAVTSVTDDAGNTGWTQLATANASGQFYYIYGCAGIAKNTRNIFINFPTLVGQNIFASAECSEFYNLPNPLVLDGSFAAGSGNATSWAVGNQSTGTDGDLIWQIGFGGGVFADNTFFTAGAGFTLCSTNVLSIQGGVAVQYQVQSSHGSITPSITISGANGFNTLAVAIKAAATTTGTTPTAGIRCAGRQTATQANVGAATTYHLQFPTTGNCPVIVMDAFNGTTATTISSITDNTGANTWVQAGSGFNFVPGTGKASGAVWYVANATSSTSMRLTVNLNQAPSTTTLLCLYDLVNAAASPLGAVVTNNAGNQVATGATVATVAITPQQANSCIIGEILNSIGTTRGIAGQYSFFDTVALPELNGGFNALEQDNGRAHIYNPNTNPITLTWSGSASIGGVGEWGAIAVEFKAASPVPFPGSVIPATSPFTLTGQAGIDGYYPITFPASVQASAVAATGAGGASSQVTTNLRGGGGGGGGGQSIVPNAVITPWACYTQPIGGAGTNASGTVFNSATDTVWVDDGGTICKALHGVSAANNSVTHGVGGATGTGTTVHSGGNGGDGLASNGGGGGGGSAGSTGNGGAGGTSAAGAGGTAGAAGTGTGSAAGGIGHGPTNGVGVTGAAPGAGGSGSYRATVTQAGAAGGVSQIVFTFTAPIPGGVLGSHNLQGTPSDTPIGGWS